jgi:hypothetical protein
MPVQTSPDAQTFITSGPNAATGEREDLSDVITQIDPDETPIYSNCTHGSAKAILHDWLVQELAAVDTANKQPEGFEAAIDAATTPTRYQNACQILARTGSVSRTMDVVDKAGRDREFTRQKVLKGLEIRRDLDAILCLNAAKDTVDPRGLAGIPTWITNGSVGATGSFATGDGTDAYTPGTARALTLAMIDDAMQAAYEDGGQPEVMYMVPLLKKAFSALGKAAGASIASNEINMTRPRDAALVGSVSVYLTDFGILEAAVDRFIPDLGTNQNPLFGIDPRFMSVDTLPQSNFMSENYAKTGDNHKFGVTWEGTLTVEAPKAHFAVFDLNG